MSNFQNFHDSARASVSSQIQQILKDKTYEVSNVDDWNSRIGRKIVEELKQINDKYKVGVNTLIVQKKGCGLSSSSAANYEKTSDGVFSTRYENQSLICVVTVFAFCI